MEARPGAPLSCPRKETAKTTKTFEIPGFLQAEPRGLGGHTHTFFRSGIFGSWFLLFVCEGHEMQEDNIKAFGIPRGPWFLLFHIPLWLPRSGQCQATTFRSSLSLRLQVHPSTILRHNVKKESNQVRPKIICKSACRWWKATPWCAIAAWPWPWKTPRICHRLGRLKLRKPPRSKVPNRLAPQSRRKPGRLMLGHSYAPGELNPFNYANVSSTRGLETEMHLASARRVASQGTVQSLKSWHFVAFCLVHEFMVQKYLNLLLLAISCYLRKTAGDVPKRLMFIHASWFWYLISEVPKWPNPFSQERLGPRTTARPLSLTCLLSCHCTKFL